MDSSRSSQRAFREFTDPDTPSSAWPAPLPQASARLRSRPNGSPATPAPWCRSFPIAHQAHGPEQIPLKHQVVKVPDALLRVSPVQNQMALDRRAQLVRHAGTAQASSRGSPDTPQ
jgi:hypothetical protein